jgi:spore germination protein
MYKIYQVEMGETLDSIANKLGTDTDTLKKINGINTNVSLMPGSFLIVPILDDRFITYTVKSGDTIYSVSSKYGIDPKLILKLNGLESETYIYPQQELMIPNSNYEYYITTQDDTLLSVSQALDKSIDELLQANENLYLQPDQMIIYNKNS